MILFTFSHWSTTELKTKFTLSYNCRSVTTKIDHFYIFIVSVSKHWCLHLLATKTRMWWAAFSFLQFILDFFVKQYKQAKPEYQVILQHVKRELSNVTSIISFFYNSSTFLALANLLHQMRYYYCNYQVRINNISVLLSHNSASMRNICEL